ncbi:serine protein kinase RIO [uncultured Amnibacterium sp.]|uniref:serine protein kinase RIO n=1 Tax=uncultured Amnibacterium sp. TaxID=1631851 RepID=UPI0035CB7B2D
MSYDDVFRLVGQLPDEEPGDGQRWSTWPSVIPTDRGPRPWPDWLVTSSAAFDTELGVVKTGKEADVFLIERAVPGEAGCRLAAKRYRGTDHRDFHRSGAYEEGRRMRSTRDSRAVERKSSYGRQVAAGHWAASEFAALRRAWTTGLPVPYPVQIDGTELLMEFIGSGRTAAPRLAQTRLRGDDLADAFEQVVEILRGFARGGFAHGDLSAYNLLLHEGRVVVIDLPQIVDLIANPLGPDLLHRDVVNVCTWFASRGVDRDAEAVFGDVIAEAW